MLARTLTIGKEGARMSTKQCLACLWRSSWELVSDIRLLLRFLLGQGRRRRRRRERRRGCVGQIWIQKPRNFKSTRHNWDGDDVSCHYRYFSLLYLNSISSRRLNLLDDPYCPSQHLLFLKGNSSVFTVFHLLLSLAIADASPITTHELRNVVFHPTDECIDTMSVQW